MHPMARMSPSELDRIARQASEAIGAYIFWQRSESGHHVMRKWGLGAQAMAECLTMREAFHYMQGMRDAVQLAKQAKRVVLPGEPV